MGAVDVVFAILARLGAASHVYPCVRPKALFLTIGPTRRLEIEVLFYGFVAVVGSLAYRVCSHLAMVRMRHQLACSMEVLQHDVGINAAQQARIWDGRMRHCGASMPLAAYPYKECTSEARL